MRVCGYNQIEVIFQDFQHQNKEESCSSQLNVVWMFQDKVLHHVFHLLLREWYTFRIKLTKQRKSANIQFSRYCSDNDLQLHTHIHEPAFIGAVGVNISVECQCNAAVTENGGQGFDVESLLCGISRKCVAELVIIVVFYLRRLQYLLVAVLHRARLNRLVRTR